MSSIVEAFDRQVRDRGSQPALWSRAEGLALDFAQLAERVEAWRRRLERSPPGPVGLAMGNLTAFPEAFLALRRLDRTAVAVDCSLPAERQLDLCRRMGITTLLRRDTGKTRVTSVEVVSVGEAAAVRPPPGTALVKITSGSTGEPAGICLSDQALAIGIDQIGEAMGLSAADRVLVAIPLSHSYGFDNGVLSLAVLGTPLVIEPTIYPTPLLRALREAEITFFPTVPPLVRGLGEVEWPGDLALRTVICAGAPLSGELAAAFRRRSGRPVHQFYGSTETGGICYERSPEDPAATGTVGHPLPGVEIELAADGRVTVCSRANFGAYLGIDEALASRSVTTGDIGEWTAEGRLKLVGRAAHFFKVAGRRISARAVEDELRAVTGVRDAAVVGLADPVRGDRLVAFVVAPGVDRLDEAAIPQALTSRQIRCVDGLPYTARGKLDRRRLRELAAEPACAGRAAEKASSSGPASR